MFSSFQACTGILCLGLVQNHAGQRDSTSSALPQEPFSTSICSTREGSFQRIDVGNPGGQEEQSPFSQTSDQFLLFNRTMPGAADTSFGVDSICGGCLLSPCVLYLLRIPVQHTWHWTWLPIPAQPTTAFILPARKLIFWNLLLIYCRWVHSASAPTFKASDGVPCLTTSAIIPHLLLLLDASLTHSLAGRRASFRLLTLLSQWQHPDWHFGTGHDESRTWYLLWAKYRPVSWGRFYAKQDHKRLGHEWKRHCWFVVRTALASGPGASANQCVQPYCRKSIPWA